MLQAVDIERVSALLIAYQRPENVEKILYAVVSAGIKEIYISLDYPRIPGVESLQRREEVIKIVHRYSLDPSLRIKLSVFSQNVGCGIAVMTACDWFFNSVDLGLVLEDDCIPTSGFFTFMQFALNQLESTEDLYIASGSRLHPHIEDGMQWELNTFPVFWGWGSNSHKWKYISSQMREPLPPMKRYPKPFSIRSVYWRAGSRRVREGHVDTWDTVISELFHRLKLRNLSPSMSFIKNVGNDQYATHEMSYLVNLPAASQDFLAPSAKPSFSLLNNRNCGRFLYNYRVRHILTTTVTRILDHTIRKPEADIPFVRRLKSSTKFYSEHEVTR
jgi:hypothetical protein